MLNQNHTYIITDMEGLEKALKSKKPNTETLERISKSIKNLDTKKLNELYELKDSQEENRV